MKKVIFILTLFTGMVIYTSCNQKNKVATVEEVRMTSMNDKVVRDSVMDGNGNTMYLTFDNPRGMAHIVLRGDTIHLKQDTTASGIRFKNAEYEYEEWQGKITLKKDGRIIFEK